MGYLDYAGLQHLWDKLKEKFAPKSHSHDDRYYTESEMDGKLNSKVNNNEAGANDLLSKLTTSWTATPTDNTYFIRQDTGGGNQFGRVKFSTIWNYIKGKADGTYQPKGSYAASGHIHDDRYYTEAEVDGKLEGKSSTDHTHDLSELISALSIGTSTTLNDSVQIITQDTDTANQKYYRRPLTVLWNYIKSKADSVYSAIGHNHKIQNLEDYTTRVYDATIVRPADTVLASPQDKDGLATFRKLDKNDVGLENVDNTADKNKNVATAGIATTGVRDYNNANNIIKIGWSGADLDANTLSYVAGYTSDMKIHTASKDGVKQYLGINNVDNTADSSKNVNAANYHSFTHTDEINFTSGPASQSKAAYIGYRNGEISAYRFCNGKANGELVPIYASSFQGKATSAGYADSAGSVAWGNISGKPSSYPPSSHSHNYAGSASAGGAAISANALNPTVTLTGGDGNTTGYRLIGQVSIGQWNNYRCVMLVNSRHQGAGLVTVTIGNNTSSITQANAYAEIKYWGPTYSGSVISSSAYQVYISDDGKTGYLFWMYSDYSPCYVRVLGSDFTINSGTWMTGIGTGSGKCIATTQINSASTAEVATVGVRDYNNANNIIKIGWSGADLDANTLSYVAGYTSDMKIHTASKDGVRSWLGLGAAAYKNIQSLSAVGHTDWKNQSTDDGYVPTMAFMAFWNGAFNGSGSSNLQYCDRGRFGTIVTKNSGDYAIAGHTHNSVNDIGSGKPTTFAYSKSGMNYGDYTWLAGWNGYELRSVSKWQFATAEQGVTASGSNYVRFGNGTQICWGYKNEGDRGGTTSFAVAFNNTSYALALTATTESNNAPFITGRYTTSFSYERHGTSYDDVQWIAVGTWK